MTLCYSDIETREALRRLKEVAHTFGGIEVRDPAELSSDVKLIHDFVRYLKSRESKRLTWNRKSPQIGHRTALIEFIMGVCCNEKMTSETTYLSVYMLDRFMDGHDITDLTQLDLIALSCVLLAGKLIEPEHRSPKLKWMARLVHDKTIRSSIVKLRALESYVLEAFNFDILVPTEINFLEIFLMYSVDGRMAMQQQGSNNNDEPLNVWHIDSRTMDNASIRSQFAKSRPTMYPSAFLPGSDTMIKMQETAHKILEIISKWGEPDNNFGPSLVAAAILLASRREHGLNFWTPTLCRITTYSMESVCNCLRTYLEPRMQKVNLRQPFEDPMFVNAVFSPMIMVEDNGLVF